VPVPVPVPVPARARSPVQGTHHVREHGDDANQELASGFAELSPDELEPDSDVEDRCALGRGAASDPIEVGLGGLGEFASSFGDVEDDGSGGSSQLVGEVAMTGRQGQDDAVGKRDEVDGGGVDIESFVVEVHTRSSSAADGGALQAMSNHTPNEAGRALMENRNGLLASIDIAQATGYAERSSALTMLDRDFPRGRRRTLGADAGYDTNDFVADCRQRRVSPHVAQNRNRRRSAIDGRTTSASGYAVSIGVRRMIEKVFGWMKTTANFRRTRLRGLAKNSLAATLVGAAYNLLRIARLAPCVA